MPAGGPVMPAAGTPRTVAGSPGGPEAGAPRREPDWNGRDPGGIDPRMRDPRWNGRDSGAPTRRIPTPPDPNPANRPGRTPPGGARPTISQPGRPPLGSVPPGSVRPGSVPPGSVPPGSVPPGAGPPGAGPLGSVPPGAGPLGTQEARRAQASSGRENPRPRRLRRFGSLQGGLGVCLIVGSTAIGVIATMATGRAPGFVLGLFVVTGTVVAAMAVRPRDGRLIFPVPVLAYLVGALVAGIIYNRSEDASKTADAIGAAQWIANGFFSMALATAAAIVLIVVRWFLWRRGRKADSAGGSGRRPRPDPAAAAGSRYAPGYPDSRYQADYPEARYQADYPEARYQADYPEARYPADYRAQGRRPDGAGAGNSGDERSPGSARDYRRSRPPAPRPGPGSYNFSSGA
jgi:uncharacterized protein DUF6542